MLIKVRYDNGTLGTVPSSSLEYFIGNKEIKAFQRSDGWVIIGVDRIRRNQQSSSWSSGPKRRETDTREYHC